MKKLLTFIVAIYLLQGCSTNNPTNNTGGACSWELTINGRPYSWTGPYPQTPITGQSTFIASGTQNPTANIAMQGAVNGNVVGQTTSIILQSVRTGSFTLNENTWGVSGDALGIVIQNANGNISETYTSGATGSNIIVNITQLDNASVASSGSPSGAGYVSGTFSGSIGGVLDPSGLGTITTATISGSFHAIRIQ